MQAALLSATSSMQAKQDRNQHARLQAYLKSGIFNRMRANKCISQNGIITDFHALLSCQILAAQAAVDLWMLHGQLFGFGPMHAEPLSMPTQQVKSCAELHDKTPQ